jgi:hypothetical protein
MHVEAQDCRRREKKWRLPLADPKVDEGTK